MFVIVAHVIYEVALYHGVKWCKWKDMKAIIYHFPRIIEQRKEYVILFWEEDNFAKVENSWANWSLQLGRRKNTLKFEASIGIEHSNDGEERLELLQILHSAIRKWRNENPKNKNAMHILTARCGNWVIGLFIAFGGCASVLTAFSHSQRRLR